MYTVTAMCVHRYPDKEVIDAPQVYMKTVCKQSAEAKATELMGHHLKFRNGIRYTNITVTDSWESGVEK